MISDEFLAMHSRFKPYEKTGIILRPAEVEALLATLYYAHVMALSMEGRPLPKAEVIPLEDRRRGRLRVVGGAAPEGGAA